MNSRQALEQIIFDAKIEKPIFSMYYKEFLKPIEKDLEILEEFEILKNYYEPFKQFLKDMFEKGYNEDLTKVKEWLENE